MKGRKDFTGGLSSLLGDTPAPQPEPAPQPPKRELVNTSQIGTKEGETRATFIVSETINEKIKAIAYWERLQIKDVVDEALSTYITQYEKKNGPIQPVPNRAKK